MQSTDGDLTGGLIHLEGYTMRQRQQGITAIGFVLIAVLVGTAFPGHDRLQRRGLLIGGAPL